MDKQHVCQILRWKEFESIIMGHSINNIFPLFFLMDTRYNDTFFWKNKFSSLDLSLGSFDGSLDASWL